MKKIIGPAVIIFILFLLFASCTKVPSVPLLCTYEITSILNTYTHGTSSNSNLQTFQYDSAGHSYNTVYSHDSIITYGGIYVYLTDANGRPQRENDIDGSHSVFTYQPDGYLSQSLYYPRGSNSAALTNTCTWQSGNLIQMSSFNGNLPYPTIYSYTYYTRPYQNLDPYYVPLGMQTTNLLKAQTSTYNDVPVSSDSIQYTYQFDTKGRVSSYMKYTGDTISQGFTLTYKCN